MLTRASLPVLWRLPGRLLRSEHLWENGYLVKMPVHGIDGPVPYMGFPVKLSAHPDIEYKAAPVLGGDNEDIYGHVLGKSKEELEELKKKTQFENRKISDKINVNRRGDNNE